MVRIGINKVAENRNYKLLQVFTVILIPIKSLKPTDLSMFGK